MRGRVDWIGAALVTFLGAGTSFYLLGPLIKEYADNLPKDNQIATVAKDKKTAEEPKTSQ